MESEALPTLFVPHGGGPCLGPARCLGAHGRVAGRRIRAGGRAPEGRAGDLRALGGTAVHGDRAGAPGLLYDYHGFPEHTYPREEHLLPLHVAAGAAGGDPGQAVFRDQVLGSAQSAFVFGGMAR